MQAVFGIWCTQFGVLGVCLRFEVEGMKQIPSKKGLQPFWREWAWTDFIGATLGMDSSCWAVVSCLIESVFHLLPGPLSEPHCPSILGITITGKT